MVVFGKEFYARNGAEKIMLLIFTVFITGAIEFQLDVAISVKSIVIR